MRAWPFNENRAGVTLLNEIHMNLNRPIGLLKTKRSTHMPTRHFLSGDPCAMRTAKASMMQRKMVSSLLLIVTIALAGPVVAADDPYMQGIQEEARKLEQLGQAKKEYERLEKQQAGQVAPGQKKVVSAPSTAPLSPTEVAAFENGLKQYPAGYGLYMQLDAKGQQAVFREYAQTAGPPGARYLPAIRLIIKLAIGKT
jgi:hypothetical protein